MKRTKKKTSKPFMLHKLSRGVSKVVILGVVALVLAGGGAYYILGQKTGMSVPGMGLVNKVALNPNCELHDAELCKFMNNWQAQKNYSVTSTSKMGGETVESMVEMDGDNFHSVTKQNGKENANMISMGDTTYMLDYQDNKWWKMTTKPTDETTKQAQETKNEFKFDEKETKDNSTYKYITKEACGNYTCFKYQIITPDNTSMKQYIWFDDSEYLLRKMSVEDPQNGSSESVFSYGAVSISAPSPVKEGSPYGEGSSAQSNPDVQKMMQQYQQQSQSNDTEQPVQDTSSSDYQ